ncbi:uncharacterized protein [Blastocystis hominis]|uniref:Cwf18 pre-mRNA splicing factor n=1 Tax=Blastocystis hominis TaxID=12968 RepID=D8M055_BLAHO|nr:uncharacterized protein [Blastocystis hominis]CBK21444.2 unnamed protein product [Blastocystis hominis]|eukprot:XP_012895492.1 uncharacterized protein [Blastocystis hominis]
MDSVEERKKRIEELKRKKAALLAQGKTAESTKPTNYTPRDENLKKNVDSVIVDTKPLSYEEDLKDASKMPGKSDELNLAPKKPNWDLKRGIEHKLDILEKRTTKEKK